MNPRILLLVLSIAALSSCSSVYKSGQTPDDVYYSPARPQADSYVEAKQEKTGASDNYQTYEQYQDSYRDDRFLRMSIGNSYYMNSYNSFGAFDWRYNSYYDGFNYGFNSPWNNYFAWNNYYNPYSFGIGSYYSSYPGGYYYGGGYYGGIGGKYASTTIPPGRPLTFNTNSYSNTNRPASRNYANGSYYNNTQRYNNSNNGSGNRSYYNNNNSSNNHPTYTPSNSSSNNTYTPSRSYTPAPSSGGGGGGGSSSGGGGGGGVSRPGRGN